MNNAEKNRNVIYRLGRSVLQNICLGLKNVPRPSASVRSFPKIQALNKSTCCRLQQSIEKPLQINEKFFLDQQRSLQRHAKANKVEQNISI